MQLNKLNDTFNIDPAEIINNLMADSLILKVDVLNNAFITNGVQIKCIKQQNMKNNPNVVFINGLDMCGTMQNPSAEEPDDMELIDKSNNPSNGDNE